MDIDQPSLITSDLPVAKARRQSREFVLTLSCDDTIGIVHAVSGFLVERRLNIVESAQFGDPETGRFFLRMAFTPTTPGHYSGEEIDAEFAELASRFGMTYVLRDTSARQRLLILTSRQGHCVNDLLYRWKSGDLQVEIAAVVSNHPDLEPLAASYGVPFHLLPVTPDNKREQETRLLEIASQHTVDLVVLARYMQILSPEACSALAGRAINIHHSFLPGFKGARPYAQAYARGVKIIGATAHYVTADLDEGPIIEQDVVRVTHAAAAADLVAIGRDVERTVLARAVKLHVTQRVLLNGRKTVVFR